MGDHPPLGALIQKWVKARIADKDNGNPRLLFQKQEICRLDTPQIIDLDLQLAAIIRLTIPRSEIQSVKGPAIGEILATIAARGLAPAGPIFSHPLGMAPAIFDFEVGVPVASPVTPTGRVQSETLWAAKVAETVCRGSTKG